MTLSEIRLELLQQHGGIRELIRATQAAIALIHDVPAQGVRELRACLRYLDKALSAHIHSEEELLGVELLRLATNPASVTLMDQRHSEEHEALQRAFGEAASAAEPELAARLAEPALEALIGHMAAEEWEILHSDALREAPAVGV